VQLIDGLHLRYTEGTQETVSFLASLTHRIIAKLETGSLHGAIMTAPAQRHPYRRFLEEQKKKHGEPIFMSYGCFSQLNSKSANMTVRDLFLRQLLHIRGMTADKALLIVDQFPTMHSLWSNYANLSSDKEKRLYFRDWSVSGDELRKFGPALSQRLYELFCDGGNAQ